MDGNRDCDGAELRLGGAVIRRIDPVVNEDLLREAHSWDKDAPDWYRSCDKVFGPTMDEFLAQTKAEDQIDIGIFAPEFCGLISLTRRAAGIYEAHLRARRRTPLEPLALAGRQVIDDLLGMGMETGYVFVAEKNRPVRKLCCMMGMQPDGIAIYRGSYKGRVVQWLRYSVEREAIAVSRAA
jgi:hypothetical protein